MLPFFKNAAEHDVAGVGKRDAVRPGAAVVFGQEHFPVGKTERLVVALRVNKRPFRLRAIPEVIRRTNVRRARWGSQSPGLTAPGIIIPPAAAVAPKNRRRVTCCGVLITSYLSSGKNIPTPPDVPQHARAIAPGDTLACTRLPPITADHAALRTGVVRRCRVSIVTQCGENGSQLMPPGTGPLAGGIAPRDTFAKRCRYRWLQYYV